MTNTSVSILHISDLHLGKDFNDQGGIHKSSYKSIIKYGGPKMQSHDPYILSSLVPEIHSAKRYLMIEEGFDLVLVTGDISTSADSSERFEFARKFLSEKIAVDGNFSIGLDFPLEILICVPGNHDKLFQADGPFNYLKYFSDMPANLPYAIERKSINNCSLRVIGIDSNLYEEGNIAVGRITPQTFGWLATKLDEIDGNKDSACDYTFLILHHHPVDMNRFRKRTFINFINNTIPKKFTYLEEGKRLIDLCKGHVDIILHGHEHFPFTYVDSDCLIVSAGSISQLLNGKQSKNSFHIIQLNNRDIKIVQFEWNKSRFIPSLRWNYNLDDSNSLFVENLEI